MVLALHINTFQGFTVLSITFSIFFLTFILMFLLIMNRWIKYVYLKDDCVYEKITHNKIRKIKYDDVIDFGVVKFLRYEKFIYISKRLLSDEEKSFIISLNNPKYDDVIIVHYNKNTYNYLKTHIF